MTKREARYHIFKKYIKSVDEKMAAMENLTDLGIAGSSFRLDENNENKRYTLSTDELLNFRWETLEGLDLNK